MSNAAQVNTAKKSPKRHLETCDGIPLEYIQKRATVAKLFGLEHLLADFPSLNNFVPVRIYFLAGTDVEFNHPLVPEIDMNYKFEVWDLSILLPYFVKCEGLPPYIFGMHGTGKSSTIEQIHARLGVPRVTVILGEDSEVIDLGGQMLPTIEGGMKFFHGLLTQSMINGWTLQIDEFDLLPTRQQKMLNEVMENRRFTIEVTGEQIKAHQNWRVCVTANTNNTGASSSGMFASGGVCDLSVNDRFQFLEKCYLSEEEEISLLKNYAASKLLPRHPKVKDQATLDQMLLGVEELIHQMVHVGGLIRHAHANSMQSSANGGLSLMTTISTRGLKEWLRNTIELSIFFNGAKGDTLMALVKRAYMTTIVNGSLYEEQKDLIQIFEDATGV